MALIPHMWTSSDQQHTILEMSESEIFGVRKPIKAILLSQDIRNVPLNIIAFQIIRDPFLFHVERNKIVTFTL
jgi:hypothetical protein